VENETTVSPQFVHASISALPKSGIGELTGRNPPPGRDLGDGHTETICGRSAASKPRNCATRGTWPSPAGPVRAVVAIGEGEPAQLAGMLKVQPWYGQGRSCGCLLLQHNGCRGGRSG